MGFGKILVKREMIFCDKFGMGLENFFSSLPGFGFDSEAVDGEFKIAVTRDGMT